MAKKVRTQIFKNFLDFYTFSDLLIRNFFFFFFLSKISFYHSIREKKDALWQKNTVRKKKFFCGCLVWKLWRYVKWCLDLLAKQANEPVGQKYHKCCHAECKIFIAILSISESFSLWFHVLLHFKPPMYKVSKTWHYFWVQGT